MPRKPKKTKRTYGENTSGAGGSDRLNPKKKRPKAGPRSGTRRVGTAKKRRSR